MGVAINTLLGKISRRVLTFKYLLHQLSPHPSAVCTSEQTSEILPVGKRSKICQLEIERVTAEDINKDSYSDEKRRLKTRRSVLPVECVKLLSDYLTWEDFSKKNAVPIIINNPHLFLSCSLNSGMTDFEYFCFRTHEKKREVDLDYAKMGYEKLKRII